MQVIYIYIYTLVYLAALRPGAALRRCCNYCNISNSTTKSNSFRKGIIISFTSANTSVIELLNVNKKAKIQMLSVALWIQIIRFSTSVEISFFVEITKRWIPAWRITIPKKWNTYHAFLLFFPAMLIFMNSQWHYTGNYDVMYSWTYCWTC